MKKIILATAFLCCTMTMMAEPVSPEANQISTLSRLGAKADAWYDLNGRRLSGKPTAKGLYIHKGKAHIVK